MAIFLNQHAHALTGKVTDFFVRMHVLLFHLQERATVCTATRRLKKERARIYLTNL